MSGTREPLMEIQGLVQHRQEVGQRCITLKGSAFRGRNVTHKLKNSLIHKTDKYLINETKDE